jgi:hypothetical protein
MAIDPWIYEQVPRLGPLTEDGDETMIHYTVTEQCAFRCNWCIKRICRHPPGSPGLTT